MVVRNPPPVSDARRARIRARDDGTRYVARLKRAWRAFGVRLPRLKRELARYAAVHTDRVRGAVRRAAIGAALGVLGAVAAFALIATAVVLVVVGMAGGLAAAFGGNVWLGDLAGGLAVLIALGGAIAFALGRDRKKRMRALTERYARFDEPHPIPVVRPHDEARPEREVQERDVQPSRRPEAVRS